MVTMVDFDDIYDKLGENCTVVNHAEEERTRS
jgi:hypothetical protein